jgi:hypothetical protein
MCKNCTNVDFLVHILGYIYIYCFFSTSYMIDRLLYIYWFTSSLRIFHSYGDVTITGEGLQNLDLRSALRTFEQGGIFIVPYLYRTLPFIQISILFIHPSITDHIRRKSLRIRVRIGPPHPFVS